jgi:hypothetical protein
MPARNDPVRAAPRASGRAWMGRGEARSSTPTSRLADTQPTTKATATLARLKRPVTRSVARTRPSL